MSTSPGSSARICWEKNEKLSPAHFDLLLSEVQQHLNGQSEVFVQDLFGGADLRYRLPVRFVTPNAWQALFVRNMFLRPSLAELAQFHAAGVSISMRSAWNPLAIAC